MLKKLKSLNGRLSPKLLLIPALAALMALVAVMTPQLHKDHIRSKVGSKVHRIYRGMDGRGGGTGFSVMAPSGKTYILTNAHVCEMYEGKMTALVEQHDGRIVPRRIIEISDKTDLCLIEGLSKDEGSLDLAWNMGIGDEVMVVGHPKLMDLTVSKGDIIEVKIIQLMAGIVGVDLSEQECKASAKNSIEEVNTGFFTAKICVTNIRAAQTNAVTLPGNSGSPVVNTWGNVVGVLFAGDTTVNWGLIVPLDDVRDFLAAY